MTAPSRLRAVPRLAGKTGVRPYVRGWTLAVHRPSGRTATARLIPRCGHCCVVLRRPDLRQTVGPFAPLDAQHGLRSIAGP